MGGFDTAPQSPPSTFAPFSQEFAGFAGARLELLRWGRLYYWPMTDMGFAFAVQGAHAAREEVDQGAGQAAGQGRR
jgi:hypothetical protein